MPRFFTLLILTLALVFSATQSRAGRVGVASVVKNQVNGSFAGVINVGTGVSENEVIKTGAESSAQLLFRDETSMTIGANARLTLDRFVYNPHTKAGDVVVNVLQGTFRFVSGSAMPGGYTIKTPAASIGLRGTVIEGFVNALKALLLVVVEGSVYATSLDGSSVIVQAGQYITVSALGAITGPAPWTGRTLDIESGQDFILDTESPKEDLRDQFNDALDSRDIDITFPPTKEERGTPGGVIKSDERLKRDIRSVGLTRTGVRLYAFRYLWSDAEYVGVMAQDLLEHPVHRYAVTRAPDGAYAVDYAALGLRLATLAEWKRYGLSAVRPGATTPRAPVSATFAP